MKLRSNRSNGPLMRIAAGLTAFVLGILTFVGAPMALAVAGNAPAAAVMFVFFGLGALAAVIHAFPGIARGRPLFQVRPGTVKAVLAFFAASLHGMVALGAFAALFFADTLWQSVPAFFATVTILPAISILFAASGYFLYSWERLSLDTEGTG